VSGLCTPAAENRHRQAAKTQSQETKSATLKVLMQPTPLQDLGALGVSAAWRLCRRTNCLLVTCHLSLFTSYTYRLLTVAAGKVRNVLAPPDLSERSALKARVLFRAVGPRHPSPSILINLKSCATDLRLSYLTFREKLSCLPPFAKPFSVHQN
jgi:hypothetical protein